MDKIIKKCLDNMYYIYTINQGRICRCENSVWAEKSRIPFTQLFDLNNENPYNLSNDDANIIRIYIGLYNEGERQHIEYISRLYKYGILEMMVRFAEIINQIFSMQNCEVLIEERNSMLREGIKQASIREKILNLDIDVLDISKDFVQELNKNNIKTIHELIGIDFKTMIHITAALQLEVFPIHVIECIHSIGLTFNEKIENDFLCFKQRQDQIIKK